MDNPSILVAIRPLHYQGKQLLNAKWAPFVTELRDLLRQGGFEDADSNEALLLFTFSHPHAAITAVSTHIGQARHDLRGAKSSQPLPLQIIVHLLQADELNPAYRNPEAVLWEFLPPEAIHITRTLKAAWDGFMAQKPLPPCTFTKEGEGLFKLTFTHDGSSRTEPLLTGRALAIQGPEKPCFYCGMHNHLPAKCPSKFLTMDHYGLTAVGYLPFEQLNRTYQQVFSNPGAMAKLLADGIDPAQIRKHPGLMVFVGFMDIHRVYQNRFLWSITFSKYSKWQAVFKAEQLQPDNKNLQLGLDCLRVGKYGQAEEFLLKENQVRSTRRFSAAIGLAFIALEQRGLADMRVPLELARSLITQPKEKIYIDLLLSRFYDLIGETWKARETVKNIISTSADCPDAQYRKLQLEAKGNFGAEACQLLRTMMIDQRVLYLASLMDPTLLPIQDKVEDLLSTQYGTMASSARDSLAQATLEVSDLALWFTDQDPQIEANNAALEQLQKRFERKSYFDVIDVGVKAKALLAASSQLREGKLNELYDRINQLKATWEGYYRFWAGYRYQLFFKEFGQQLLPLESALQQASVLAKRNEGKTYQEAMQLLGTTGQALTALKPMQAKMNWVNLLLDSTISFGKKLVITEIGGALLATSLFLGLGQLGAGHELGELGLLASDPLFQKKASLLIAFLIAPLVALTWTIKEQLGA